MGNSLGLLFSIFRSKRKTLTEAPEIDNVRSKRRKLNETSEIDVRSKRRKLNEASSSISYHDESPPCEGNQWKMSDSLYKLYEPTSASSSNLDIFFFHGFQFGGAADRDIHLSTWKSADGSVVWPQCWLPNDYPGARIIIVSYDACIEKTGTQGMMDLHLIGENLMTEIISARKDHGNTLPVILVGHGIGGLVMKQLCKHAQTYRGEREMSMFLDSIRGFFFYATPHLGIEGIQYLAQNKSPILKLMKALNKDAVRLHEAFCKLRREKNYQWQVYGIGAANLTKGPNSILVREASSRSAVDNYITHGSNYFSVCRPNDKKCNRYQHLSRLVSAVTEIFQARRAQPQIVPETTVGVEALVKKIVEKHLRRHSFLGLCGMSGLGKTTIAKLVFNKIYADFEYTCFLQEVKLIPGTKAEIRKEAWGKMHRHGNSVPKASDLSGDEWNEVTGKVLLVVFDDIQNYEHAQLLSDIAKANNRKDSCFIVTTRDEELLRFFKSCGHDIHILPVETLRYEDARKLFMTYAFPGKKDPPQRYEKIVQEVVMLCDGLPLTLEVLGQYLGGIGDNMRIWIEIPDVISRACGSKMRMEERVWAKLQLSFEGLGDEEKNMFLDFATLFSKGKHLGYFFWWEELITAWSSLYGIVHVAVQTLVDRSLLKCGNSDSDEGKAWWHMHELLKAMGERIARESGRILVKRTDVQRYTFSLMPRERRRNRVQRDISSLSDNTQDFLYDARDFLQDGLQLDKVIGLSLVLHPKPDLVREETDGYCTRCQYCILQNAFSQLKSIRYMYLEEWPCLPCSKCNTQRVLLLPESLIMLHVNISESKRVNLRQEACSKLVVLKVKTRSSGFREEVSLNQGILSSDTFHFFKNLEVLELSSCDCIGLSLGQLRKLRHLNLVDLKCIPFRDWPKAVENLVTLEWLFLDSIEEPFYLPDTFMTLPTLEVQRCTVLTSEGSEREIDYFVWKSDGTADRWFTTEGLSEDSKNRVEERASDKLQLSFDGLGDEEKNMFLDSATLFGEGKHFDSLFWWEELMIAWSSLYGIVHERLETLEDRFPLRRGKPESNVTTMWCMPEHLTTMGERIAREGGRILAQRTDVQRYTFSLMPRRTGVQRTDVQSDIFSLSDEPQDFLYDARDFLQDGLQLEKVIGLSLVLHPKPDLLEEEIDGRPHCQYCILQSAFSQLKSIRYMYLEEWPCLPCSKCGTQRVLLLPESLVMLHVNISESESVNLRQEACSNLIVLKVKTRSSGYREQVSRIQGILSSDTFHFLKNLEFLELSSCDCIGLSLGQLRKLRHLNLVELNCIPFQDWPEAVDNLENLERLFLGSIEEPFHIPDTFMILPIMEVQTCTVLTSDGSKREIDYFVWKSDGTLDKWFTQTLEGLLDRTLKDLSDDFERESTG